MPSMHRCLNDALPMSPHPKTARHAWHVCAMLLHMQLCNHACICTNRQTRKSNKSTRRNKVEELRHITWTKTALKASAMTLNKQDNASMRQSFGFERGHCPYTPSFDKKVSRPVEVADLKFDNSRFWYCHPNRFALIEIMCSVEHERWTRWQVKPTARSR